MSEREALERFHNWRAARGRDAESHRPPRSNRVVRITVPFSIAITALGMAAGSIIVMRLALTQISCATR
jgi:hypothetical protein